MNNFNSVLALSVFVVLLAGTVSFSYADYISPKKQLDSGVLPEDVICRNERVLVQRTNGNVACVSERTAERLGWDIIATEFVQIPAKESHVSGVDISLINSTDKIIPINSIEGNLLENIPYPMFVYEISDKRLITTSDDIKNGSSHSGGTSPWPKTTFDTPSQVKLGEPFDVTFTWSMVEFDKETGEIDDISPGDENSEGVWLKTIFYEGVTLVSASGFELTDQRNSIAGGGVTLSEYKKQVDYDDTQIHSETLTFQIDEQFDYPFNSIRITANGGSHKIYFTYSGDTVFLTGDEMPFLRQLLSEESGSRPFKGVTTFEEDAEPNPQFIDSLADFLINNISTTNMTHHLQQEGISDSIIDVLFQKYPELES